MSYGYTIPKIDRQSGSPQTELQKIASKENNALFQLTGMLGNLKHFDNVIDAYTLKWLRHDIRRCINEIKQTQLKRKEKRNG